MSTLAVCYAEKRHNQVVLAWRGVCSWAGMRNPLPHEDLTAKIIACAIEVHTQFGPGLLESVYQDAFGIELATAGLTVVAGLGVPLVYKGHEIAHSLRLIYW
jgi:hypothetical protein